MGILESVLSEIIDVNLRYHAKRVPVLAQNIANIDTPGYQAQDVKAPDFARMVEENQRLTMTSTHNSHLSGVNPLSASTLSVMNRERTYETSPTENNVTLEQETQDVSISTNKYHLSLNLHETVDRMYKAAIGLSSKGG